jgi:hypothetical protein
VAAAALAEAYGMTRDACLRVPAEEAVAFTLLAQSPGMAWRYGVRDGDSDTSHVGWALAALRSAELAGLSVPDAAYADALLWIARMTDVESGRVGYQRRGGGSSRRPEVRERFPPSESEALTAVALFARLVAGEAAEGDSPAAQAEAIVLQRLLDWNGSPGARDL